MMIMMMIMMIIYVITHRIMSEGKINFILTMVYYGNK
jgi:hypothetical protein